MNKKKAQNRFVFACLAPAVILVFIFMVIPTIDVFKTAFFKKSNFVSDATFAGVFNFKVLFNDMRFIEAMQNTILYVVLITIITLVLAVLFATLLTREEFVGKNFFRVIFYIPNILSIVVIAGIFSAIYQPTNGILNTFFGMIGLSSISHGIFRDLLAYCLNRTTVRVSVRSLHRNIQCGRTKQNTLLYQRHRIDYEYHTRSAFHLRFRLGNCRF